jgi:hypothetical protein
MQLHTVLQITNLANFQRQLISLSNIFRNADFYYLIFFCKWIMNLCGTGIQWLNECDWKQKSASVCVINRKKKKLAKFVICNTVCNCIYDDINKSNKRQTYTHYMGVLGEKCSPKWANFTLKQGVNLKKNMPRRIFF